MSINTNCNTCIIWHVLDLGLVLVLAHVAGVLVLGAHLVRPRPLERALLAALVRSL